MRNVEWAKLTAPELREIAAKPGAIVLLPVGSLEQHGPHLPTFTDTASASAASVEAAKRVNAAGGACVVLPGLWTGMSEHHLPFGGTISLNYSEFHGVLRGVARSLRAVGFSRLMIVNGHGGNVDALALSARELAVEFGFPIVAVTPWFLAQDKVASVMESDRGPKHACEGETSLMMAIWGEHVRAEKLDEAMQQAPKPAPSHPGFSRFRSFSERAPVTGTWGDPRSANADKGAKFLAIHAEALAETIRDEALWSAPDPVWRPGRGQGTTAGAES